MKCKKETKIFSANPKIYKVNKNSLTLYNNELSSTNKFEITLNGNFLNISNVYLSSSDVDMFYGSTYYNPFSGIQNLSAKNLIFYAKKIENFSFSEKFLIFDIPEDIRYGGFVDIIIENESGYTKLTKDSILKTNCNQEFNYNNSTTAGIFIKMIHPYLLIENDEGFVLQENNGRIVI